MGEQYGTLKLLENTGSATSPAFSARTGTANPLDGISVNWASWPALVDIDADGDLDGFSGGLYGFFSYFENTGSPQAPAFADRSGSRNPLDGFVAASGFSSLAFGDLDGDGDFDALAGSLAWWGNQSAGRFLYFENTGSATSPAFVERTDSQNPLDGVWLYPLTSPELADLDGDGDLDLATGTSNGVETRLAWFENTGSATSPGFVQRTGSSSPLDGLAGYSPELADLDGDGDLDLFSGEGYDSILYFENTGSPTSPAFVLRSGSANPLGTFHPDSPTPALADLDGDGDLDAVSGSFGGTNAGTFLYFENRSAAPLPVGSWAGLLAAGAILAAVRRLLRAR